MAFGTCRSHDAPIFASLGTQQAAATVCLYFLASAPSKQHLASTAPCCVIRCQVPKVFSTFFFKFKFHNCPCVQRLQYS